MFKAQLDQPMPSRRIGFVVKIWKQRTWPGIRVAATRRQSNCMNINSLDLEMLHQNGRKSVFKTTREGEGSCRVIRSHMC